MAARYWVGGTANWDATAGTKWSLTSGGAGGQAVPTSADDVFLDASSGAVTVTLTAVANAKSFNCTGYTGTLAGSSGISVSGGITLSATMTCTGTGNLNPTASGTLTSNGKTWSGGMFFSTGVTCTLADDWTITGTTTFSGTVIINGNNLYLSGTGAFGTSTVTGTTHIQAIGSGTFGGTTPVIRTPLTFNTSGAYTFQTFNYGTNTLTFTNVGTSVMTAFILGLNTGSPTVTINDPNVFINLFLVGNGVALTTITINGTYGCTIGSINMSSTTANSTLSLKFGNTYFVNTSIIGTIPTAAAKNKIISGTPGSKVSLTLNPASVSTGNDVGYVDFTDIDNSLGRTVWTYKGTISNCNNINLLPTQPQPITN